MEYSLAFDGVVFRYPDTLEPALQGLSCAVPKGSRTAVLGHNGSGKSTLLLQAVGVLRPQQGSIMVSGRQLGYNRKELADLRRRAGLVFQDPEQQLILSTPQDDISFGLRGNGMEEPEILRRCGKVLELLNLGRSKTSRFISLAWARKSARRLRVCWQWSRS